MYCSMFSKKHKKGTLVTRWKKRVASTNYIDNKHRKVVLGEMLEEIIAQGRKMRQEINEEKTKLKRVERNLRKEESEKNHTNKVSNKNY